MPASGAVDIATHASPRPSIANRLSMPAPARSPPLYRKTSTIGFALYFSAGATTENSVSREGREMA